MPDIIQNGAQVRLIVPVIEGEVKEAAIISGEIQYRVEYVDQNGDTQERFFPASSLELIP
jgi:hypothetical protein